MTGTLSEVMDGLSALMSDVSSNNYAYPVDSVTVPCTVVGYPTSVDFDLTFARGGDTFTLPVWVVVGKTASKDSRDVLSVALTGVASVKEALDGAHSFGDVRVQDAEVEIVTIGAVSYLSLKYLVEVI